MIRVLICLSRYIASRDSSFIREELIQVLLHVVKVEPGVLFYVLTLSQTGPGFYAPAVKVFENTAGKGEIARNEQFLLFPLCFPPIWKTFCHFHEI